mgnify:CR=1 FL=1
MQITEIAFSCYPVTDMPRAQAFYEGVLGLKVTANYQGDGMHWVEYDIGAGTLALGVAPNMKPSATGCSVSLEVADFDQAVAELKAAQVPFAFGPFDTGVCRMAFVHDPDGNSVGIHQRR